MAKQPPDAEVPPTAPSSPGDAEAAASGQRDGGELALLRAAVEAVGEALVITSPELDLPGPRIE